MSSTLLPFWAIASAMFTASVDFPSFSATLVNISTLPPAGICCSMRRRSFRMVSANRKLVEGLVMRMLVFFRRSMAAGVLYFRSCRTQPSSRQSSFCSASCWLRTVSRRAERAPSRTHTAAAARTAAFFALASSPGELMGAVGTLGD